MTTMRPPTLIGRLLHEISWEGNARPYREGGRGRENVLTAEVFLVLDFLPAQLFSVGFFKQPWERRRRFRTCHWKSSS